MRISSTGDVEQTPGGFADGAVVCEAANGLRGCSSVRLLTEDVKQKVSWPLTVPRSTNWNRRAGVRKIHHLSSAGLDSRENSSGKAPDRGRERRKVGAGGTVMT